MSMNKVGVWGLLALIVSLGMGLADVDRVLIFPRAAKAQIIIGKY